MTIEIIVKRNGDENNSDAGDEQTHNETSRIRNVASLLILTTWTLGYHVAPEDKRSQFFIQIYKEYRNTVDKSSMGTLQPGKARPHWDLDDDDYTAPNCSLREELPSFILLGFDCQEGASANKMMVFRKHSFLFVLLLTVFFVCAIFTLKIVVALVVLLQADTSPGISPMSSSAHQISPILTVLICRWLVELFTSSTPTPCHCVESC